MMIIGTASKSFPDSEPEISPIILVVSGYTAVGHWFQKDPTAGALESINWAIAMLAMSMTTNIILTILTAGRIWLVNLA
jgi:hypothetical protein